MDPALTQLLQFSSQNKAQEETPEQQIDLWLLGETESILIEKIAAQNKHASILTNRFDVYSNAKSLGLTSSFNDWKLPEASSPLTVYFRIQKEKPVNYYLVNQLAQMAAKGSNLILSGAKNEGIKNFIKQCNTLLGSQSKTIKNGDVYYAVIPFGSREGAITSNSTSTLTSPLNDQNYCGLRSIAQDEEGRSIYSKPGAYGWDKVDKGSELLKEMVLSDLSSDQLSSPNAKPLPRVLDLGCGYGYLSLMAERLNHRDWLATDNCAAALEACKRNCQIRNLNKVRVEADDCAVSQGRNFDLILCNPPFHSGFKTDSKLNQKFFANAAKCLTPDGKAYFVVNSFIPLENIAQSYFRQCVELINSGSFKVFKLAEAII